MRSARAPFAPALLGACLVLAASCRSVEITPQTLEHDTSSAHARVLKDWNSAVALANEFLTSHYRRTLPAGRFELGPRGMRFVMEHEAIPIEVRSTGWGDWVVQAGFAAQERESGFVVGAEPPRKDPLVDHSFFRDGNGTWLSPRTIAELTLHETTHVIYREGTVGFWNGAAYYLEAIFLFRYSNHSAERHANATSEEFEYFVAESHAAPAYKLAYRESFESHIAAGPNERCTHGSEHAAGPRKRE